MLYSPKTWFDNQPLLERDYFLLTQVHYVFNAQ